MSRLESIVTAICIAVLFAMLILPMSVGLWKRVLADDYSCHLTGNAGAKGEGNG